MPYYTIECLFLNFLTKFDDPSDYLTSISIIDSFKFACNVNQRFGLVFDYNCRRIVNDYVIR